MIKETSLRRDPDLRGELAFLARGCDFVLPSRFKKRLKSFQQQQVSQFNKAGWTQTRKQFEREIFDLQLFSNTNVCLLNALDYSRGILLLSNTQSHMPGTANYSEADTGRVLIVLEVQE